MRFVLLAALILAGNGCADRGKVKNAAGHLDSFLKSLFAHYLFRLCVYNPAFVEEDSARVVRTGDNKHAGKRVFSTT